VSPDRLAALGAFLSGAGSVISAIFYVKRVRQRAEEECNKRMQAFKNGLHEHARPPE
jgi:homoserine kinase